MLTSTINKLMSLASWGFLSPSQAYPGALCDPLPTTCHRGTANPALPTYTYCPALRSSHESVGCHELVGAWEREVMVVGILSPQKLNFTDGKSRTRCCNPEEKRLGISWPVSGWTGIKWEGPCRVTAHGGGRMVQVHRTRMPHTHGSRTLCRTSCPHSDASSLRNVLSVPQVGGRVP